ncbi:uncharacterized protein LOC119738881 isoform X2 [Patiria miniata]|uniref:Uncharacterized protein n=1 Tax=Patiria miniata TaxID=46514 RepID=A0A914B061_PATMI|nr:uncharacterized protein LOC119738881 isoform X2 [Patiria miniata]
MDAEPKTLNKQTLTPWKDAADPPPHQAVSNGNSNGVSGEFTKDEFAEDLHSNETPNTAFDDGGSSNKSTKREISTSIDETHWNIPDDASDWPVMSNGNHDDLSPDGTVSTSAWGDGPTTHTPALDIHEASQQTPSSPTIPQPSSGSELTANPFGPSTDMFGAGFTDNFCEMSETDLIFRSGLVDEEFKTISVTAEEDDLWSSFAQPSESESLANQSAASASWDPFPANQEPPNTDQVPVQSQPDPSGNLPNQIGQSSTSENHNKISVDVPAPRPQVLNILQSVTSQHSSATALSPEEDTSIQINQHRANEIVHYESEAKKPSNEIAASSPKPQSQLNIKQLLKDSAFKEIILDESWMAEKDCLESKAFTVDLSHRSANQDTQDPATSMDLLSDQPIPNTECQPDTLNGQHTSTKTATADLNANMATNGGPQDLLVDFGDTDGLDGKIVVAPPPEFDNNFDPLLDNAEGNSNMVSLNSELSNGDLLISIGNPQENGDQGNPDKETDQGRTASDLDKLLNDLGDGTVIDEDKDTCKERTSSDVDRFLNQLGDGTAIDEIEETSQEQAPDDGDSLPSDLGDARVVDKEITEPSQEQAPANGNSLPSDLGNARVVDKEITEPSKEQAPANGDSLPSDLGDAGVVQNIESNNRARTPSDMDRFLNDLGDGTVIDDEDKRVEKGQTPSDIDRFLNELGDGTVIDEANDSLAADGVRDLDTLKASEQEDVHNLEKPEKLTKPEEKSAHGTNKAWDQMVREGSITMQESAPKHSSNTNGTLSSPPDTVQDIGDPTNALSKTEGEVVKSDAKNTEAEPAVSQTDTKLDLNAKRRSFFGGDSNAGDSSFQPTIPKQPSPSAPISSMSISLALPSVRVLPKVQTAYQRPGSLYETKPRAATDSFLSSHALLGLGGDQTISADTKSRSASEPPISTFTIAADQPSEEAVTSPRSKDPSVANKSTQFIRALYGPKPGSKSSEQVDEDGKTLFEYEQERRNVMAAMKVKRKKKISWQGSSIQSDDLTSPESEGPLSPTGKSSDIKQEPPVRSPVSPGSTSWGNVSNSAPKLIPEPCKPTPQTVEKPLNVAKQDAIVPEVKTQTLQEKPPNIHAKSASPVKVDLERSPITSEDKKSDSEVAPKKINTSLQSVPSTQEIQSKITGASSESSDASKAGPAGSQEGNDEAHIDLKKVRNLWEQKINVAPSMELENRREKKDVFDPRRMFSLEMKDEDAPREEPTAKETKPKEEVRIETPLDDDSTDIMPKDLDDEYDHCESFTYDVTPQRKVAIQSHRTSESIITREIRQQKEREQELLKEGRLKSSSDMEDVEKEDSQVQLIKQESFFEQENRLSKNHAEGNVEELPRTPKIAESRGSSIKSPRNQSGRVSPRQAELQDMKLVEPEVTQKVEETQQRGPSPEPTVVIIDKDESKTDTPISKEEPRRKESIIQREIRLQKEREGENALERQRALEETRARHASGEGSSHSSSGRSTPIKGLQSPTLQSSSFTSIKAASTPAGPKTVPIKPALTPATPKKANNAPMTSKLPDKSPVVRFGLSSMQAEPYNSYREYQKMLRGRKTSEKSDDKPGPMKATEGSVTVKQPPVTVVFKESAAKESTQQRPPSPVVVRPPSPFLQRPPSPSPYRAASPVEEPSSQDATDSSPSKPETLVQREIRLAKEREAELQKERAATKPSTDLKKAFDADIPDVVIVEKTQKEKSHVTESSLVTESSQVTEKIQVSERSSSVSSPEQEVVVLRRRRETPMERDIRLAEEREMTLRKERGLSLKRSTNTPTSQAGRTKPPNAHNPRPTSQNFPDSTYNLKTVNYYIEKEFEEERRRELALKVEGKIKTVSQYEDETSNDTEATLSPVKSNTETLIEQEIRLQQEREDQYRREKGLATPTSPRLTEQGADGVPDGEAKDATATEQAATSSASSETPMPKYRPQRRSLIMAQQWEDMFK